MGVHETGSTPEKGWRATFYTTGMEYSPTSATGTGWERTPWHATQRAAWEVLTKAEWNAFRQVGVDIGPQLAIVLRST